MPRTITGPRRATRSPRAATAAPQPEKVRAVMSKKPAASARMQAQLEEMGFDPIKRMVDLCDSKDIRDDTKAKLVMEITSYVVPKQRAADPELDALKRRLEEGARFVILGEREDEDGSVWEARNSGRVPSAPVVDEKVPDGVVPS